MTSDGQEIWLDLRDPSTNTYSTASFTRVADQHWTHAHDFSPNGTYESTLVGTYMTSAGKRALVNLGPQTGYSMLAELSDDGTGTWSTVVRQTTLADLGLDYFDEVGVTPDGRRMIFAGEIGNTSAVYEVDRVDATLPFGKAVRVANVPYAFTPYYLSSDCSRLYFAALDSVFYVPSTCTCK
jgi:hypothetical protein